MNSHLSFDLLDRYSRTSSFAGIQFDFAKCVDSIPYTVIWDVLLYHGCGPMFFQIFPNLYIYGNAAAIPLCPGCLGSPWAATNGLWQGDPLSVVILNCVLRPLLRRLACIPDLTGYAFALILLSFPLLGTPC